MDFIEAHLSVKCYQVSCGLETSTRIQLYNRYIRLDDLSREALSSAIDISRSIGVMSEQESKNTRTMDVLIEKVCLFFDHC